MGKNVDRLIELKRKHKEKVTKENRRAIRELKQKMGIGGKHG